MKPRFLVRRILNFCGNVLTGMLVLSVLAGFLPNAPDSHLNQALLALLIGLGFSLSLTATYRLAPPNQDDSSLVSWFWFPVLTIAWIGRKVLDIVWWATFKVIPGPSKRAKNATAI